MSNTGTVPEQETKNGTDEASINQTRVISTQELVDSMVAIDKSMGPPKGDATIDRRANFQRTQYVSSLWSVCGDTAQEPAFRKDVEMVLGFLHKENPYVSRATTSRGER